MGQGAALEPQARRPHGQLMGDEQRLMALGQVDGVAHGGAHAGDELGVGLAPARPQGVEVVAPVVGMRQDPPVAIDGHALEVVPGLDEARVGHRRQVEGRGGRRTGLARPLQRGGDDRGDVVAGGGQHVGDLHGHLQTQLGEVVAGQAPVQDALGVVDLAVPHEVDRRARHVRDSRTPAVRSAARCGRGAVERGRRRGTGPVRARAR